MMAHTCIGEENRSSEPVTARYINAYRTLVDWLIVPHESFLLSTDHHFTKKLNQKKRSVSIHTHTLRFALKTNLTWECQPSDHSFLNPKLCDGGFSPSVSTLQILVISFPLLVLLVSHLEMLALTTVSSPMKLSMLRRERFMFCLKALPRHT